MTIRATMELISASEWRRECIDIRRRGDKGREELHPVKVWRYREMAVHHPSLSSGAEGKDWSITHVPSGLTFGCYFKTASQAMACAVEIDRIRNNWSDLDQDDVRNMRDAVLAVIRAHGAKRRSGRGGVMHPKCNLNGYGG